MRQLFISHVKEDSRTAVALAADLERQGYTCWCYERDSVPGVSYLLQTKQAVEQSEAFVVLISRASLASHQMTKEIVRAHESEKPFVPILLDLTHVEFQQRQPEWREAIGAATSIRADEEGTEKILPRVIAGLAALGVLQATPALIGPKDGAEAGRTRRFVMNPDGTVSDPSTRLMWAPAPKDSMHFDDAKEYVHSLRLGDYRDWRLPTIKELKTLFEEGVSERNIDDAFNTCGHVWSNVEYFDEIPLAWTYNYCCNSRSRPGPSWCHCSYSVLAVRDS